MPTTTDAIGEEEIITRFPGEEHMIIIHNTSDAVGEEEPPSYIWGELGTSADVGEEDGAPAPDPFDSPFGAF